MRIAGKATGVLLLATVAWYIRDYRQRRAENAATSSRQLELLGSVAGKGSGYQPGGAVTTDAKAADLARRVLSQGPVVTLGRAAEAIAAEVGLPRPVGIDAANGLAKGAVVAGYLEHTIDAYSALQALSGSLAAGALALVVVPNAAPAPSRSPLRDPLSWVEALAGHRYPEALSRFQLVDPGGEVPDIHFTAADIRRLAGDAGFDVVEESGLLEPSLYFTLRKSRPPRPRPRQPWWPMHTVDKLPLDYMTTREDILALVPASSTRVLDVGCAAGALGLALRERGARVTGIELDPDLARRAAEVLDDVVVGDASQLLRSSEGLDADPYDCVVFADCLEHLVDPWTTLADAVKHLGPGGVAVVSLPNIRHWDTLWQVGVKGTWPRRNAGIHDAGHLRQFTRRDAVALMAGAGLEVETVVAVPRVLEGRRTPLDAVARALPGAAGELVTYQWLLVGRRPAGAAEAAIA